MTICWCGCRPIEAADYRSVMEGEFIAYARSLKKAGVIRHLGMSTHNPAVAKMAAQSGEIEVILFSINPAFDLLPATEDVNTYFAETAALHRNARNCTGCASSAVLLSP